MQILSNPISALDVRKSQNFRVFKKIEVEELDGDVRFLTKSGNTGVSRMRNKKHAILAQEVLKPMQILSNAIICLKFTRIAEILVSLWKSGSRNTMVKWKYSCFAHAQ